MITVDEALQQLFALCPRMETEHVPLARAHGRVLAEPVAARRDQPPFAASAMDGYAIREAAPGARLRVIGESAAGAGFAGIVGDGEAVRIFTGAPLPKGADRVVIQEDVSREGDWIVVNEAPGPGAHIRPAGGDFRAGATLSPRLLKPADIALAAAMNHATLPVARRPQVALIATGDELVQPGEEPGPDQIVASNGYGLAGMIAATGGRPRLLPIARDNTASLRTAFALAEGADLVVTIGGASVGDRDLVAPVAAELGMKQAFYKIAMRPGKPLMAGRLRDGSAMVGLPGNPVSSMVCGTIFILPMLRAMLGLPKAPAPRRRAPLAVDIGPNGPREHYMRARLTDDGIAPFERQDSALLTVLAEADALLVRPIGDAARRRGELVEYVPL